MKKDTIYIVLILLALAAAIYCCYWKRADFEKEKQAAVEKAVKEAIDSLNQRKALELPKQASVAHKPPKPELPPAKKEEKKGTKEVVDPTILVDKRDGKKYRTFESEGLQWMAQNLDHELPGSWCYNEEDPNCKTWGRLYTWDAAMKVCPEGWRLPNDEEWDRLINRYGGIFYAGKELKEGGSSGFNAEMSGYYDKAGYFDKGGVSSYYWSSTEQNKDYASFKGIYKEVDNVGTYTYTKADGLSVRCVRDVEKEK